MKIELEAGQVWGNKNYYKVIIELSDFVVRYEFYNKKEFYFTPNQRRRPPNDAFPQHIEVTETIRDFLCNRVLDKLELLERYFNRKPCVGVDTHVKRDYLYYKSIQDKFNEEFEVVY